MDAGQCPDLRMPPSARRLAWRLATAALLASMAGASAAQSAGADPLARFPSLVPLEPSHQALLPSEPWSALSPAKIARYKTLWSGLDEHDVPPYPLEGFEELLGVIRQHAKDVDAREVLMLVVELDSEGAVVKVKPARYSDDQLLERANWAVIDTRFSPAQCNRIACASTLPIVVKVPR
jgi:hypothetical protein